MLAIGWVGKKWNTEPENKVVRLMIDNKKRDKEGEVL